MDVHNKKLRVGFQDLTIKVENPDFKKDNLTDCYGQYLQRENSIQINAGLETHDLLNTVTWTEVIIPDNSAIELCDCHEHIPTNIDRLRFQQFNRFTPGRAINGERIFRWYIEPQGFRYHDKISLVLQVSFLLMS